MCSSPFTYPLGVLKCASLDSPKGYVSNYVIRIASKHMIMHACQSSRSQAKRQFRILSTSRKDDSKSSADPGKEFQFGLSDPYLYRSAGFQSPKNIPRSLVKTRWMEESNASWGIWYGFQMKTNKNREGQLETWAHDLDCINETFPFIRQSFNQI